MHVNHDHLSLQNNACPFCLSKDRDPVHTIQTGPDVLLYRCNKCYAVSAYPVPDEIFLKQYYNTYYMENDAQITHEDPARFAKHIYKIVRKNLKTDFFKIIDYGGGNGLISINLAQLIIKNNPESKIDISVVDYNNEVVNSEDPRITISNHKELSTLKYDNYDIIISSAIFEHIPFPGDIMIKLFELLSPGGIQYTRTPFIFPFIRIFKIFNKQIDFTYPAHLHDLGQYFWNNIYSIMGFTDRYRIIRSTPSIVESSFRNNMVRTILAYMFKMPWYIFRNRRYSLVGGWEIFIRKVG